MPQLVKLPLPFPINGKRTLPILKHFLTSSSPSPSPSHALTSVRSVTYMPRPGDGTPRAVTLIPGDGIGPLVTGAVEQVMEAMHAPVLLWRYDVHGDMKEYASGDVDGISNPGRNKVWFKREGWKTPVGGGVSSLNVQLRKELDLYASLVHCFNLKGLPTRHENVDIVVIRENTEGEYSGLEHEVVPGVVESLKVMTKFCSERIAKYAFEYAYLNNRKVVTAVHKANIMENLLMVYFWESCRRDRKQITLGSSTMRELWTTVACNLYQSLSNLMLWSPLISTEIWLTNTAAGIAGGTGCLCPGGNVGGDHAVFEQGASAGNVGNEKILEQKKANPIALFLSSAMMLRHLQFPSFADRLETSVKRVIAEGKYMTKDLGGDCTTQEITDAVIANLD
uniref:NADP-dependent isocitrate dehydrogenase-like protein n=1 Tax=Solanum lycopersicum TaxID=4081 RepID=O82004_SOLLC|nr:NADP-dependent isocitrate dehydrogenase-like protein [Solanum lycopersicum]